MNKYRSTKEIAKDIRQALKRELPGWKFSVTASGYGWSDQINLHLMAGPEPVMVNGSGYGELNHYSFIRPHFPGREERISNGVQLTEVGWQVMEKATEILSREHWDESEPQVDYFRCAYYRHVTIGKWDKPYQVTGDIQKNTARRRAGVLASLEEQHDEHPQGEAPFDFEVPFDFADLDEEQVAEFGQYLLEELNACTVASTDEDAFRQWLEEMFRQWRAGK